MILIFQKRAVSDPNRWEDLTIPEIPSTDEVEFLMGQLSNAKAEGHYRVVSAIGGENAVVTKFHVYRREVFEALVEG